MESSSFLSAPPAHSVLDRRGGPVAKNQLLNLAFEDDNPTHQGKGDPEEPKSVPADVFKQGVREHAMMMGMLLPEDERYLWIAEESLLAPLPEGWVQLRDEHTGHPYYYHQASGDSSWEHPRDGFYKEIYRQKKADRDVGVVRVPPLMPPEPPVHQLATVAPKYTSGDEEGAARCGRGAEQNPGDGDSACGDESSCEITVEETRGPSWKEVHRLRRQLQRSKESRKALAEQYDEAAAKLERIKEDLEDKIEAAADELRQERRRVKTGMLERERVDKMAAKLKETTRELEGRLEMEAQRSENHACTVDDLRSKAETYKRQLEEVSAQTTAEISRQNQEFERQWAEAKQLSGEKLNGMKRKLEEDRQALKEEAEQMRAKMDFQVDEGVREATSAHKQREKSLIQDLDALRSAAENCKQELAKIKSEASAAEAAHSAQLAEAARTAQVVEKEGNRRNELEREVTRLTQELQEADVRSDALSADLAEKNKLVEKVSELQKSVGEAQEGLRAANDRFDQAVMRMNTEVADAEHALEQRTHECKRLESAMEDAKAGKDKAEALTAAEREEVQRLSVTAVGMEASLNEARAKEEILSRQLQSAQQRVNASEGLERDLQRLGREAEDMHKNTDHQMEQKQREVEMFRTRLEEGDALSRKLRGSLAQAEGRAVQEKGAADRLMKRVSALEAQVLEGRAELSSTQADRNGFASELATAREAVVRVDELKALVVEAKAKEEVLRVEAASLKTALKAMEATVERERQTWSEARTDLQERTEGAERRSESLQSLTKELAQNNGDAEQRFQKELEKSKEREAGMWSQLQQVSSSFAAAASSTKEGETTIGAKLGVLEQQLRDAEAKLLDSQAECERARESARREARAGDTELENLRERLSRKKDKFAAQKLALENVCKTLTDRLSEARVVEEGMRARCEEVLGREEKARAKVSGLQEAKSAADQEAAGARAEATGLKTQLENLHTRLQHDTSRLRADVEVARETLATASAKSEADLRTAEEYKIQAEARCKILQDTTDRLEGDLATISFEVAEGKIGRDVREVDDSQEVTGLKFKVVEAQGEIQQLSSRLEILQEEKRRLEQETSQAQARYLQLEDSSSQSRDRYHRIQEENEKNKRRATVAQEEADVWKAKFDAERALRRALNAKVLDMQGSIRVLCRLRPLQQAEVEAIEKDEEYEDPMANITYPDVDRLSFWGVPYQFDYVFGPGTEQEQVFDEVQPIVASALEGYRVCVFAYGQTGSGKTHTMEGPKDDRGVNFRALGELFTLSTKDEGKAVQFRVSMLEVYNESIKDLFVEPGRPAAARNKHDVRLDKKGRVYVEGLVECEVETLEEVEELVILGGRNRTVGNNNVNEHSSRSHLVLQVHITTTDAATGYVQHGKLNLIDLAGSERIKSTAAEGQQLKEAQNINRSLSALGDVINALGSGNKHVPYRNSKLTFLLQDSLSSNAKVLMFVNINPAPQSQGESSCSLNFAKRCRSVQLGTSRRIAR